MILCDWLLVLSVNIFKVHPPGIRCSSTWYQGFPGGSAGKEAACNVGDLGWEDALEMGTATPSSILAWKIPRTVQSVGLQRVRHD